jgi:predicted enzyme related to lactoylglutathione lyase
MNPLPKPGAVIFAKDMRRIAEFYRALVGLQVTHEDDAVIMLESASQQIVIHGVPAEVAASIQIASPPRPRENAAVKLVFPVDSIADVRARAPQLGGALHGKNKEFQTRGFRTCDGHDPEGNVIQFRENAP